MQKLILIGLGVIIASSGLAQTFFDDFNRADGPLGANYTNIGGPAAVISSNKVTGSGSLNNLSLVNTGVWNNNYALTKVEGDIATVGTALQFAVFGFAHNGNVATGNGLYIKIQSQTNDGLYGSIGFYTGNGVSNATAVTGGAPFFTAATPFSSAHVTIWCTDPTTVNLGLDTDFNGIDDQVYTRTLAIGPLTTGNQVGVGVWGTTTIDNFRASVVPEPATMAALSLGALALIRRRRSKS